MRQLSCARVSTWVALRSQVSAPGFSVIGVRAEEYGRHFPQHGREYHAVVQRRLVEGVLRPAIGARLALADAKQALAAMAGRAVTGKIVLTMGGFSQA